ncbi:hypothetical protein ACHAPJ_009622 [Fusarium lateritium]
MTSHNKPGLRSDANRASSFHTPSQSQERTIRKPKDNMAVNKQRQDRQLKGQRPNNRTSQAPEDSSASETSIDSGMVTQSSPGISNGHQNREISDKIRHLVQLEMSRLERKVDFDERDAKFREELAPHVTRGSIL